MKKVINNLYSYGITIIFFAITLFLCVISAYCTTYITSRDEHSYFLKDSILTNLVFVVVILFYVRLVKKNQYTQKISVKLENNNIFFGKCKKILLLISFALGVIWVTATQYIPGADQYKIQDAVYLFHLKDYQMFFKGGYLDQYQNQLGFFLYSYVYSLIFGSYNYIVFQITNAIGVTFIYKQLSEIGALCGQNKLEQLLTIITGMLFFPLTMYSSFVYGNVLGLLFSLLAVKYELIFFKSSQKKYAVFSASAILLATLMKSNYIIFLVGMLIYAIIEIISGKKWKHTLIIATILAAFLIQSTVPGMIIKKMTGIELGDGTTSMAFIAMGLQESKQRAPGWYNGYNASLYKKSGYDEHVQNEMAMESIKESIEKFKSDKKYAGEFFIRKIASMYTEPTFQSFWISQIRKSSVKVPNWSYGLLNIIGYNESVSYLNLFQFAIYVGAILYCIFCRKNPYYMQSLILLMIFVGGFVFHLFWEAKGQYTFSYFVLLFPYAVSGFGAIFSKVEPKELCKGNVDLIIVSIFTVILFAFLSKNGIMATLVTEEDKKGYNEFVEAQSLGHLLVLEDGAYKICTAHSELVLNAVNNPNTENWEIKLLENNSDENATVNVATYQGSTRFWFNESGLFLEYGASKGYDVYAVDAKASSITSAKQKWILKDAENACFYIMYNDNRALTYNVETGEVYVSAYTGDINQQWKVDIEYFERGR